MNRIHATAVVHPQACLGDDVEIGPFAIVEDGVLIGDRCRIGAYSLIATGTRLGADNHLYPGCILGLPPQDLQWRGTSSVLEIGARNVLREGVTLHRGSAPDSATVVGSDNYFMVQSHAGHNCRIGDRVILANHVLLAGHVEVGDGAFVGGGAAMHQFGRIGRLVMVSGLSRLRKDVPPFLMVAEDSRIVGLNVVGLRRAGWSWDEVRAVRRAVRILYREGNNVSQALARLEPLATASPAVAELAGFVRSSRRGICTRFGRGPARDEPDSAA